MKHIELICRTVFSVDAMAKAKDIKEPHLINELAGIAARALSEGKTEAQAYEAARLEAVRMVNANAAIDHLLNSVTQTGTPLAQSFVF